MKEQFKVFPVDEKMQILTKINSHVGTRVDLTAMLGLSVSTVNTIVSQQSGIENSYLCCGPSFSKEYKSLKLHYWKNLKPSLWHGLSKCAPPAHPSVDPTWRKRLYI